MRRVLLAVTATVLIGCGSYKGDMQMMCDAPKHVDAVGISPEVRAQRLAEHIAKNVKSTEGRRFFQALANVPSASRVKALEEGVREAGIDPAQCEMLKYYE